MSCSSEGLIVVDGALDSVTGTYDCIAITSEVISIDQGTTSSWVFKSVASHVSEIDFSQATNLESIGDYAFYSCCIP